MRGIMSSRGRGSHLHLHLEGLGCPSGHHLPCAVRLRPALQWCLLLFRNRTHYRRICCGCWRLLFGRRLPWGMMLSIWMISPGACVCGSFGEGHLHLLQHVGFRFLFPGLPENCLPWGSFGGLISCSPAEFLKFSAHFVCVVNHSRLEQVPL